MTDTLTTKLGTTRRGERTRIWLQGQRLVEHGFVLGGFFKRKWSNHRLVLTVVTASEFEQLKRDERGTVSGNDVRPVIDIVGQQVADCFDSEHVAAKFSKHRIVITEVAS